MGERGRRPGSPDTRAAILAAARELFADRGFSGATIRAIAAHAGVDPALVHHYYGTKADLLVASLELPVDPREVLAPVAALGPEGAGERLMATFLSVWDDPEIGVRLRAFARHVLEPGAEVMVREGFLGALILPLGETMGIDQPGRRMPLVASQIIGLVMMRYVLEVEPIASMPPEELVATLGPALQRYLTGPLPEVGAPE